MSNFLLINPFLSLKEPEVCEPDFIQGQQCIIYVNNNCFPVFALFQKKIISLLKNYASKKVILSYFWGIWPVLIPLEKWKQEFCQEKKWKNQRLQIERDFYFSGALWAAFEAYLAHWHVKTSQK